MPEHIIRAQFESWCFVDDTPSPALVQRRLLESDLYFGILYPEVIETPPKKDSTPEPSE